MMYVAVIPTVLSGLFLLSHWAPQELAGYLLPNRILFGFTPLILGVGIVGLVIGFLPLFRFHLATIKHRHEWTLELRTLAEWIIAEKTKVLRPPQDLRAPPMESVVKTVTELQAYCETTRKVRMSPVTVDLFRACGISRSSQPGQLLAFIETVRKVW